MNSPGLGPFLREQRNAARLSLRQLAEAAGVSNPYLSQIERGLRKPSAEVLQHIAQGLRISAEALYQRAGLLDEDGPAADRTRDALRTDPGLGDVQRVVLLALYDRYRRDFAEAAGEDAPAGTGPTAPPTASSTEGETMSRIDDLVDEIVDQLKKNLGESSTFYAAAGLADLVAQRLRDAGEKAEEAGRKAQARAGDFTKKAQDAAREGFDPSKLQQAFEGLPQTLVSRALDVAGKAEGLFSELASHGKDVVDRHTRDVSVVDAEDSPAAEETTPAAPPAAAEEPAPAEDAAPTSRPAPAKPRTTKPRTTKPRTTKPRTTKPRTTKPRTTKPATGTATPGPATPPTPPSSNGSPKPSDGTPKPSDGPSEPKD